MAGISAREISYELIGSGTMSSEMPNDSTCSRNRDRDSTDQASSILTDGSRPQMLFTPNAAIARSTGSESPCCVPTFIFAFGALAAAVDGALATWADTTASASAATGMPAPASLTNSRRFMEPPDATVPGSSSTGDQELRRFHPSRTKLLTSCPPVQTRRDPTPTTSRQTPDARERHRGS